jgi:alpha-1,3-mannosyl-glycoprotein beta-1,2-N-acetylglucosaminyltransferase
LLQQRKKGSVVFQLKVEDDMLVAPDFFDYFSGLAPLLHSDETLLCVSAWNDNGMEGLVAAGDEQAARELRRTSVFPGLGWMLTRSLWDQELRDKWPKAFWDDWLREPAQTRGRDCIFPTVSRSKTIGEMGSSSGQFFGKYLSRIVLNDIAVDWEREPLRHLQRDVYRRELLAQVRAARTVGVEELKRDSNSESKEKGMHKKGDLRVFFKTAEDYEEIADKLGLMNDLKAGLPRSSFEGIVRVLTSEKTRLFVVPEVPFGRIFNHSAAKKFTTTKPKSWKMVKKNKRKVQDEVEQD